MNSWRSRMVSGVLALAVVGLAMLTGTRAGAYQAGNTYPLWNGEDFEGWYTFIPEYGKNNDPLDIFTIEDGVIHVSGEKFGFLSTEEEFENYRLTLDFKWGEKKYPPRENAPRDSGILYHCVGPDKVWNKSLELQIQENDTGDMWLTAGEGGAPSLTVLGKTYTGGRVVKFADYEKPHGEWNTVAVVARGDRIWHWVNGRVNMVGSNASLTKGRINLQSEGAEVFFRNITIELLP